MRLAGSRVCARSGGYNKAKDRARGSSQKRRTASSDPLALSFGAAHAAAAAVSWSRVAADCRDRRAALEQAVLDANEVKSEVSQAASLAWEDFSLVMKELERAQARQRATILPPE